MKPHSDSPHTSHSDSLPGAIRFLFGALFLCGALFFVYQVYDILQPDALAEFTDNLPDFLGLQEWIVSVVPTQQPTRAPAPNIIAGERVNVLLLGTDCRPADRRICRTDTMMIATFDPKTATAGLITIPRDLYVPIPTIGENRINAANSLGEYYKYPGGGTALAMRTVEYNFGRRIDYYVLVDFDGFRQIVDTLGGIDIDVPKPINDPTYPGKNYDYDPLYIPAGHIHMDGELALKYARTRHGDDDFGRSRRQVEVLKAIREKALRLDIVPKLPSLLQSMGSSIQTDMPLQQIVALAQQAAKVKTENIRIVSIESNMTVSFRTTAGADVLWPDQVKIAQLMDQIIPVDGAAADSAGRIKQEAAGLLVLNGTNNSQLAERTVKYLRGLGFQISAYGNADRFDYAKTVLIDYKGNKSATIAELARIFRVTPDNIRRSPDVKSDANIRIILGADWNPP